jgi:hypothetical protein
MIKRKFSVQVLRFLLSFVLVLGTLTIISCNPNCSDPDDDKCDDDATDDDATIVLAEYQAWHGLSSHSPTPYDSRDPDVISKHIQKAKDMGIHGFVINWYGYKDGVANDEEREFMDQVTAELIRQAEEKEFRITLMYDEGAVLNAKLETFEYTSRVRSDLNYAQKYFSSPAYLRINGYPSLFIFPYDDESNPVDRFIDWPQVRNELSTKITLIDEDPNPNDSDHDDNFDGFYAWVQATSGKWDTDGKEWGEEYLNWFYSTMNSEPYANKVTVGGVWPGFDDRLASWGKNRYMSRQKRQIYDKTMALAKEYDVPIVMIATWNDFEEGTDIEFGVEMIVDMEDPYPELLVRSSPVEVKWDPNRGDAVLQVYKDGEMIHNQNHSSGVLIALESGSKYELKIWVSGAPTPIAKWIKIRSQDPIPNTSPIYPTLD